MNKITPYAKAVVGFITPGAVALGAAVLEGSPGGSGVTAAEWVTVAVACVVTGGAVFTVPNREPARHARVSVTDRIDPYVK